MSAPGEPAPPVPAAPGEPSPLMPVQPRAEPAIPPPGPAGAGCHRCAEPLAADQRYCLGCGARRGAGGPIDFTALLRPTVRAPAARAGWRDSLAVPLPVAASMLTALLVTGVLLGGLGGTRTPDGFAAQRLSVVLPPAPPAVSAAPTAAPPIVPVSEEPAPSEEVSADEPAADPEPAGDAPAAEPPASEQGSSGDDAPAADDDDADGGGDEAEPATGDDGPAARVAAAGLPAIKHVFVVALAEQSRPSAFTAGAGAPYLSETLVPAGTFLRDVLTIADSGLANAVALISGQAPTAQMLAGCPIYADVAAVAGADPAAQDGCVHPAAVPTLAGELERAQLRWRAYVEDQGNGGPGAPATCRHPALGAADPWRDARAGDAFATARNPFVYFHAIIDVPACAADVVGLDVLDADLAGPADDLPAFGYIVPNLCHDGRATPCAPDAPAGPAGADAFLAALIPKLQASSAYADSLVIVTFDQATPASVPQPAAAAPPVAGKVGALLLSPHVRAGRMIGGGRRDTYTMLATIARILGVDAPGLAAGPGVRPFGPGLFDMPQRLSRRSVRAARAAGAPAGAVAPSPSRSHEPVDRPLASRPASGVRAVTHHEDPR